MERFFLLLMVFIFSRSHFKGSYRLALNIYSYKRSYFQRGVWLRKKYLDPAFDLEIYLFSKDLIDHKILFTGVYEPETNWALQKYLRPGDVVLEAGANSGTETVLISRLVGGHGGVIAFEPVDHVLEKLKNNLRLNSISNVEVLPIALGAREQDIDFFVHPIDHPNQGMGSKSMNASLKKIVVTQKTIDSLIESKGIRKFDFLKMDVQGAEFDILMGSQISIKRFTPKIFLEASEGWSNIKEIYDYLAGMNYKVFWLNPACRLEEISISNLKEGNWLALPQIKA